MRGTGATSRGVYPGVNHKQYATQGLSSPFRLWFLGDSLTEGANNLTNGGFRKQVVDGLTTDGRPPNCVGTLSTGSFTENEHDGHSGIAAFQMVDQMPRWLEDVQPVDIVCLMIGINDLAVGQTVANTLARIGNIMDIIFAARHRTWVSVSTLFPNGNSSLNTLVDSFNAGLPTLVSDRTGYNKRAHFSNAGAACPLADVIAGGDNTHPIAAGYAPVAVVRRADINAIYNAWV
jgi:lysophospholipase L1-like esterase